LHDRYGQLVNVYTKLLLTKISFHLKHPQFPAGLEVTDEVLEKTAGTDVNNIFQLTVEMFDYMDCELRLSESGKPTKEEARPARVQCDPSGPTAR